MDCQRNIPHSCHKILNKKNLRKEEHLSWCLQIPTLTINASMTETVDAEDGAKRRPPLEAGDRKFFQ